MCERKGVITPQPSYFPSLSLLPPPVSLSSAPRPFCIVRLSMETAKEFPYVPGPTLGLQSKLLGEMPVEYPVLHVHVLHVHVIIESQD